MVTCKRVVEAIEKFAPAALAAEWDNAGFQIGHPSGEISSILVTLDVTEEVLEEAFALGAGMIVSHHPVIFKPLKGLRWDRPLGRLIAKALEANIHVYAAHTSADSCSGGVNDCLARKIGLEKVGVLQPGGAKLYKIVVFVPEGYEEMVRNALGEAGAGWLGQYSHCSFMSRGTGAFKPLAGARPFIGKQGRLEEVGEYRVETIVPETLLQQTINRMLQVHPYEEAAYDIYPLENRDKNQGLGRIGELPEPLMLNSLAEKIKDDLGCPWVLVSGPKEAKVKRVAVCGGSGADLIPLAKARGAEVLVTGDVKYHQAMTAKELGISLIDAGHNATERILVPELAGYLRKHFHAAGEEVQVFESKIDTNPWESLIG